MDERLVEVAKRCLAAADDGSMTFPQIVGALMNAGFESYTIDFRRGSASYYLADGAYVDLEMQHKAKAVAAVFNVAGLQAAIREAQQLVPGYTYKGFCEKVTKAGCAGYSVSFLGRRALYFGRTAETHTEHFPQ